MNQELNQLKLLIKTEYITDIRNKSFWIATFLVPILVLGFGVVIGFLAADSDTMQKMTAPTAPEKDISTAQAIGMMVGTVLILFLMTYGAQVYSKVRKEKVNRIMEVLATCVTGRTMMLAKVISVALIGLTQLALWFILIAGGGLLIVLLAHPDIPWHYLADARLWTGLLWCVLFLFGGYVFYAALYAACGAMTDKDNENQSYMTILTFLLLGAMYISMYATDNVNAFTMVCSFIPFTAPSICVTYAIAGLEPIWVTILQLLAFTHLHGWQWHSQARSTPPRSS